ncbi:FG-GAP-like repeat-containing protein [Bacteroidota bacterium]
MANYTKCCFFLTIFTLLIVNHKYFAQEIPFDRHTVDLNFPGAQCLKIIDLDNDGDLDIIGGSEITQTSASVGIAWWRNDGGYPITWTRIPIDASFIHVMSVDAAYVDSDGHLDIIATSWNLHQMAWWKNSGNPETGWTKYVVKNYYTNAHDAKGVDIDLDGDTDIVSCNSNPGSVDICYNQNATQPTWNHVQLDAQFNSAKTVKVIDLDLDGDLDIVGAADGAHDIAWWDNTGNNSQVWQKTTIENFLQGVGHIDIIDMNNDQKLDIIASAWVSNQVAYYICNDLAANNWTRTVVTTELDIPGQLAGCDFDNDGDIDIAALGKFPGEAALFLNDNFNWTKQTLRDNFNSCAALAVADLDQDGDQDIIAGAGGPADIFLFENQTVTSVEVETGIPNKFELMQNYPNPFNPATTINYNIPPVETQHAASVKLVVYNLIGQEVATLVDELQTAGTYSVTFDAEHLSSGVYFYRLQAGTFSQIRKMILLR